MKMVLSDLFAPTNKPISCSNVPWRGTPRQTCNGAVTGKRYIFEMLSNWLCVTKIVVLIYKAIEHSFKGSSANLFKLDRKQVADFTMNSCFIHYYLGWLLALCKRVGRSAFPGRQFNKAI
jgi:hypothetical protein